MLFIDNNDSVFCIQSVLFVSFSFIGGGGDLTDSCTQFFLSHSEN